MRYLSTIIKEFANQKFVLISGPRQVGKTTIAKEWLEGKNGSYLNWDVIEDRQNILKKSFLNDSQVDSLILDELHKYQKWKSWLKGLYDKEGKRLQVIVTGSARLDVFQKGGDSLLGRYEKVRLHPYSVGELTHGKLTKPPEDWLRIIPYSIQQDTWEHLERRSGFPEPFLKDDALQHQRWAVQRRNLLLTEDLRDLTQVRSLSLVEHLAILLPSRVGSLLSVNSLREELEVSHDTVKTWLNILDRLYYCYRISPYSHKISRSLKKEQKLYLWDWSQVEEPAARFENMVASHLLKAVDAWNDVGYGEFELKYFRDKEKNEVDFVITNRRKPIVIIECKLSDTIPSKSLIKLAEKIPNVAQVQLVSSKGVDKIQGNIRISSADLYLSVLP